MFKFCAILFLFFSLNLLKFNKSDLFIPNNREWFKILEKKTVFIPADKSPKPSFFRGEPERCLWNYLNIGSIQIKEKSKTYDYNFLVSNLKKYVKNSAGFYNFHFYHKQDENFKEVHFLNYTMNSDERVFDRENIFVSEGVLKDLSE